MVLCHRVWASFLGVSADCHSSVTVPGRIWRNSPRYAFRAPIKVAHRLEGRARDQATRSPHCAIVSAAAVSSRGWLVVCGPSRCDPGHVPDLILVSGALDIGNGAVDFTTQEPGLPEARRPRTGCTALFCTLRNRIHCGCFVARLASSLWPESL